MGWEVAHFPLYHFTCSFRVDPGHGTATLFMNTSDRSKRAALRPWGALEMCAPGMDGPTSQAIELAKSRQLIMLIARQSQAHVGLALADAWPMTLPSPRKGGQLAKPDNSTTWRSCIADIMARLPLNAHRPPPPPPGSTADPQTCLSRSSSSSAGGYELTRGRPR